MWNVVRNGGVCGVMWIEWWCVGAAWNMWCLMWWCDVWYGMWLCDVEWWDVCGVVMWCLIMCSAAEVRYEMWLCDVWCPLWWQDAKCAVESCDMMHYTMWIVLCGIMWCKMWYWACPVVWDVVIPHVVWCRTWCCHVIRNGAMWTEMCGVQFGVCMHNVMVVECGDATCAMWSVVLWNVAMNVVWYGMWCVYAQRNGVWCGAVKCGQCGVMQDVRCGVRCCGMWQWM